MMSPLVQERLGKTFAFFSYGILTTAATVYACRNTMAWAAIPWWGYLGGTFAFMYGAHAFDYQTMFPLKLASYTAMTALMGLQILPLVQGFGIATAADAALATGLTTDLMNLAMISSTTVMGSLTSEYLDTAGAVNIPPRPWLRPRRAGRQSGYEADSSQNATHSASPPLRDSYNGTKSKRQREDY